MPFYLIKQTLLVEADDELAAARVAAETVSSAETLKFEVKLDETAKWHLQVPFPRGDLVRGAPVAQPNQVVVDKRPAERPGARIKEPRDDQGRMETEGAAARANDLDRKRGTVLTFGVGVLLGLVPCLLIFLDLA